MKKESTQRSIDAVKPADHLANERTFLSWVRTSIALMGFGFVIVKFSLFIKEISIALGEDAIVRDRGYSALMGVGMVSLGAIMTVLAYVRYINNERQLSKDVYIPSKWLSTLVTFCIVIGCILLVFYLLQNI